MHARELFHPRYQLSIHQLVRWQGEAGGKVEKRSWCGNVVSSLAFLTNTCQWLTCKTASPGHHLIKFQLIKCCCHQLLTFMFIQCGWGGWIGSYSAASVVTATSVSFRLALSHSSQLNWSYSGRFIVILASSVSFWSTPVAYSGFFVCLDTPTSHAGNT